MRILEEEEGVTRMAVDEDREKLDAEIIGTTGLENVTTQEMFREIIRRYDGDPTRDGLEKTRSGLSGHWSS